ncbi:AraC family transcriptional regulator [Paenibacillus cisolokensis]|uniref:AraC family transcriptional regulator n=1 Tax=Paenibacillus cisolokensis TaxID=1658519 RepID=UPI003D2D9A4E
MYPDIIFPDMTSTLQITGCHFGNKPAGWHYPKHHHHLYEVLHCQEGEAGLVINRAELTLHAGEWLLIRAGVRHEIRNGSPKGSFSFFNIHFDIDDVDMRRSLSRTDYSLLQASVAATTKLPSYIQAIESQMHRSLDPERSSPSSSPTERRLTLTPVQKINLQAHILLIIQEIISLEQADSAEQRTLAPVTIHAADTAHLIEEQLRRLVSADGSIAQIADELNMSRSQFSKIFKQIYGVSPRQYVTDMKLNLAKQLLVSTNRTIEDIADELGYHSASHFSRQFRRGTGLSPNQFRPRHRI